MHSDVTSTKEQLLARNEELEAESERLRKDFDETEWALAEATSKWMHLEQVIILEQRDAACAGVITLEQKGVWAKEREIKLRDRRRETTRERVERGTKNGPLVFQARAKSLFRVQPFTPFVPRPHRSAAFSATRRKRSTATRLRPSSQASSQGCS